MVAATKTESCENTEILLNFVPADAFNLKHDALAKVLNHYMHKIPFYKEVPKELRDKIYLILSGISQHPLHFAARNRIRPHSYSSDILSWDQLDENGETSLQVAVKQEDNEDFIKYVLFKKDTQTKDDETFYRYMFNLLITAIHFNRGVNNKNCLIGYIESYSNTKNTQLKTFWCASEYTYELMKLLLTAAIQAESKEEYKYYISNVKKMLTFRYSVSQGAYSLAATEEEHEAQTRQRLMNYLSCDTASHLENSSRLRQLIDNPCFYQMSHAVSKIVLQIESLPHVLVYQSAESHQKAWNTQNRNKKIIDFFTNFIIMTQTLFIMYMECSPHEFNLVAFNKEFKLKLCNLLTQAIEDPIVSDNQNFIMRFFSPTPLASRLIELKKSIENIKEDNIIGSSISSSSTSSFSPSTN